MWRGGITPVPSFRVALFSAGEAILLVSSGKGIQAGKEGSPQTVNGLSGKVQSLTAGNYHTCALLQGGAVQCWGLNSYGQLGNGDTSGKEGSPQTVTGLSGKVQSLTAGNYHTCALIQGGAVQCWGSNFYGQLGKGDTSGKEGSPQTVTGLSGTVQSLTAGENHTCALIQGGIVQCWGSNSSGQLGNGDTGGKEGSPQTVTRLSGKVQSLTAGEMAHLCPHSGWNCSVLGKQFFWSARERGYIRAGGEPSNCHWTEWNGTIPHSGA